MKRFPTRVVRVGCVEIGGNNPIRIQSMTNTDTADVIKTTEQIMRLEDCGCEIVRLTIQGAKEVCSCEKIRSNLIQKGYKIPLVADIHFSSKAAMLVSDFVDKVRINPGNFVKQPQSGSDIISKVEIELLPLIEKLKKQKKALRIGVNHGSLSERIMHLYGNTPEGMVRSAIEYGEICRKFEYNDLVFSMKASNPLIMIAAYRLLVETMIEKNWDYPLHLGVTEAGDEDDGIIKSSFGTGALLLDGIGDTIRVSLTADPEKEIPPAKKIALLIDKYNSKVKSCEKTLPEDEKFEIFKINTKRDVKKLKNLKNHCLAILDQNIENKQSKNSEKTRSNYDHIDAFFLEGKSVRYLSCKNEFSSENDNILLMDLEDFKEKKPSWPYGIFLRKIDLDTTTKLKLLDPDFIFFSPEKDFVPQTRLLNKWLDDEHKKPFLIAAFSYIGKKEDIMINAAAELGSLLADDIIDGICLRGDLSIEDKYSLSFAILQSSRKRTVKTEYISCPGCGRTLYDIQTVTKNIKVKTSHLAGIKIAIMGCIVNGPGEMADADFGFVGSGKNKVDLYVGKKCVEKNIDFFLSEERLIEIIKKEGRWIEKT